MDYAHPEYLISTDALEEVLEDPGLRIFDTTVFIKPDGIQSGLENYLQAHLPRAGFLDLVKVLSDRDSPLGFTLPSDEQLELEFRAAGIEPDGLVVLYSTNQMMWATRLWWMLYYAGHKNIKILDGGYAKWIAEGRPVNNDSTPYPASDFKVQPNPNVWADKDDVLAAIGDDRVCTVCALSPEVYSGKSETNYGRPGHIKGSRNLFYATVLDNECFRPAADIKRAFEDKGAFDKERVITYCGGAIAATVDAFALSLMGHKNVAVYDGSMSEWARDDSLPMETGADN